MQFLNIKQLILVRKSKSKEKAQFSFCVKKAEHWEEVIKTDAYIGKNGMTANKIEGDGKTPSGKFGIGVAFGTHEKIGKLEYKKIPEDIDYDKIINLASEARQKLNKIRPTSLGQAMRISGVNPSDISILSVYMKRYFK